MTPTSARRQFLSSLIQWWDSGEGNKGRNFFSELQCGEAVPRMMRPCVRRKRPAAATTELAALETRLLSAWKTECVSESHHSFVQGALFFACYTQWCFPRVVSNTICGLLSGRPWIVCHWIAQRSAVCSMRQLENMS